MISKRSENFRLKGGDQMDIEDMYNIEYDILKRHIESMFRADNATELETMFENAKERLQRIYNLKQKSLPNI